jgi:hypothetical protein
MNQYDHDELGTQLTRTLNEHADVMSGSSLGLAEVKGRARSIRRRRTATAVAGVAAAVAVIVPTVSLATHTSGKPEPAPVTQTPSPTQTATPDSGHQPKPGVLDVSDLPTGDRPGIEYVTEGRVLHRLDGSTVDIPARYPVSSFVVLTDGTHVWQTAHDGTPYVEVEEADGTMREPVKSQWGVQVSASHSVAAWVTTEGQVMTWSLGDTKATPLADPITAGQDLRIADVEGDDCSVNCGVVVNVGDAKTPSGRQPWLADANGTHPLRDGSYLTVADNSPAGLTIGYRKLTEDGSCSTVLGGGEFQPFTTCKHTLVSFSPDGNLILADPAYHDGPGNGVIGMYDLEGNLLWDRHSTEKAQAVYPEAQWEDAAHVLAATFQDGKWSVVRFASDGSMEYAVPPAAGQGPESPYVLATGGPALGD